MKILWSGLSLILLAACVQTGGPRFEPDYAEAARINTQLGMDYLAQGRVELAQFKLEKALEQDRKLPTTHLGLALVHQHYEEYDKAEKYFRKARDLAPRDTQIQTRYAAYLCQRERLNEAAKLFDMAERDTRNPAPAQTLTEAGRCYLASQQLPKAEEKLRRALELNSRHGGALLQMAQLSYLREDYLRARAFLQRYESAQSVSTESLLLGLRTEYQLGDERAARGYASRLRKLAPGIESRYDLSTGQAW